MKYSGSSTYSFQFSLFITLISLSIVSCEQSTKKTSKATDDDDDTTITPVPRSGDYNIKINLILLGFGLILFLI